MLVGSNEPIVLHADAIRARARVAQTAEHYSRAGIDLSDHVENMLRSFQLRPSPSASPAAEMMNTDLFPRDELRTR